MRVLQDDENKLYERLVTAAGGPVMTPNDARSRLGLKDIDGGDELRTAAAPAARPAPGEEKTNNDQAD